MIAPETPMQSARWIEALDRQSTIVMAIFARAGFEPIAPPVIQPADVFLDLIGEDLRARSYIFTDPAGTELCLRPDLTIPACRAYLERAGGERPAARFSYNGPVFRYQTGQPDLARPREFRQAGIESFAAADPAKAEAEILALTLESVRAAGLRALRLQLGDLGILNALLDAIHMPARWRARLRHHFWRPDAFRSYLQRLTEPTPRESGDIGGLVAEIGKAGADGAAAAVGRYLDGKGLNVQGTRRIEEIAQHLWARARDMHDEPLSPKAAEALEAYLALSVPVAEATTRVRDLARAHGLDLEPALAAFDDRLRLIGEEGVELGHAIFSGAFGRAFEYYTGFVFEIRSALLEDGTPLCGGGRYDTLVAAISGGEPVPAVGAAIHCERLLLAVRGGRP